jgi:hypothetical protein
VNRLPREARDGLTRAWLEILKERFPGVTWVATGATVEEARDHDGSVELVEVAV